MQIRSVSLKEYSNYKIGATAKNFAIITSIEDLQEATLFAKENNLKTFVMGEGTNILFSKESYDDYLMLKIDISGVEQISDRTFTVNAGENISNLVISLSKRGYIGLEWAGGLPGTFGGAVRGNAGAFGGEIKDSIVSVTSYNLISNKLITRTSTECNFKYRDSIFKNDAINEVIVSALINLNLEISSNPLDVVNRNIEYRQANHPMEYPSLGSTFKNIPVESFDQKTFESVKHKMKTDPFPIIPVAYLIDQAGLKGYTVGGIEVSTKQPNFLVNKGRGTAKDVIQVIDTIKSKINDIFNVNLETEIQIF